MPRWHWTAVRSPQPGPMVIGGDFALAPCWHGPASEQWQKQNFGGRPKLHLTYEDLQTRSLCGRTVIDEKNRGAFTSPPKFPCPCCGADLDHYASKTFSWDIKQATPEELVQACEICWQVLRLALTGLFCERCLKSARISVDDAQQWVLEEHKACAASGKLPGLEGFRR